MVGHVSPEAARGGPIARLRDGDRIVIDVEQRVIETDADLASRPVPRVEPLGRSEPAPMPNMRRWSARPRMAR